MTENSNKKETGDKSAAVLWPVHCLHRLLYVVTQMDSSNLRLRLDVWAGTNLTNLRKGGTEQQFSYLKVKFEDVCSSVVMKPIHPGSVNACVIMVRRAVAPEVPRGRE